MKELKVTWPKILATIALSIIITSIFFFAIPYYNGIVLRRKFHRLRFSLRLLWTYYQVDVYLEAHEIARDGIIQQNEVERLNLVLNRLNQTMLTIKTILKEFRLLIDETKDAYFYWPNYLQEFEEFSDEIDAFLTDIAQLIEELRAASNEIKIVLPEVG